LAALEDEIPSGLAYCPDQLANKLKRFRFRSRDKSVLQTSTVGGTKTEVKFH
jgi:hypothetical protein